MEYTEIADFYDNWSTGDPVAEKSKKFYIDLCLKETGKVIELGVGTGRIAIEIAKKGKKIIGVDNCKKMLDKCKQKAKLYNVCENIQLINKDVRRFEIKEKANLITFPFRSIGHLLGIKDKTELFQNVYNQLLTGGVFVFDHYIFDKKWATAHNGITRLMYNSIENNRGTYIWDTYTYDFTNQLMNCFVTYEKTGERGISKLRKIIAFQFSWLYPEQVETLANKTGFKIIKSYGDFNYNVLNEHSNNQIWFLQKK